MSDKEDFVELPPDLGLFDSIRDVGYGVEHAIADLIDNSLAAEASEVLVNIVFDGKDSFIRLEDNGKGMSRAQLNYALTFGRKPSELRSSEDLGRFGMGLKAASLSQGRRVTVASRQSGMTEFGVWDTDSVNERGWVIKISPFDSTIGLTEPQLNSTSGSIVIVEILDKLLNECDNESDMFYSKLERVYDHLGLIFHRFITGLKGRPPVQIIYQGKTVSPVDPFSISKISINGEMKLYDDQVLVKTFILPHETKLSKSDLNKASLSDGLTQNQGFFIYRVNRLIVCGGWLNMREFKMIEPTKLCRVMIEIPNNLDEQWGIDIKKSRAIIPNQVYSEIRNLVKNANENSLDRYRHRSTSVKVKKAKDVKWIWVKIHGDNGIRYKLNRKHPLIDEILKEDRDSESVEALMKSLLDLIEINLPVSEIIADGTMHQADITDLRDSNKSKLESIKNELVDAYRKQGLSDAIIEKMINETDLGL
jgi:hypothetical protein